jgi:hypothetical protein
MKLLTKSDPTTAPRIDMRDDPAYRRASEKLADLTARAAELEARRRAINEGLHEAREGERDSLAARAALLLQDDAVPRSPASEQLRLRTDLGTIEDELAVVRRAIELQRETVAAEGARVARELCERARPQHRAIVGRIAAAVQALDAALAEEQAFRERFIDAGVPGFTGYLRPAAPRVGRLEEPHSGLWFWAKEMHEAGLLSGSVLSGWAADQQRAGRLPG